MASTSEYEQQQFWKEEPIVLDAYKIHMKYKELGGYGVFIGNEPQYIKDKEKIVNKLLKEYISKHSKYITNGK